MLHDHPTVRRVIYIVAALSQVAAFFAPAFGGAVELTDAFQQTANFLGLVAAGTALSNVPSKPPAD